MKEFLRITAAMVLLAHPYASTARTRKFLDAPTVKDYIRVRWDSNQTQYAIDNDAVFRQIASDALFLTKRSVFVTYPLLNPLNVQAKTSIAAVDDPTHAIIKKLIDAIVTVGTTVGPLPKATAEAVPHAAPKECRGLGPNSGDLEADTILTGNLYDAKDLAKNVKSWKSAIADAFDSGASGPKAIAQGTAAIAKYRDTLKATIDCGKAYAKEDAQSDSVGSFAMSERVKQIEGLHAVLDELYNSLDSNYVVATKWTGPNNADYIISAEVKPSAQKMQTITVNLFSIEITANSITGVLSVGQKTLGTTVFTVQQYSTFATEIGTGAVFGTLTQPKYGTATNAEGETVISQVEGGTPVSVNPSVLVNFVCRCGPSRLTPMVQIGASTSKSLPAALIGAGIRLFGLGAGDVAIGGGAMFGWVKDLQKLKVGDVVAGTKDIESDLGYRATPEKGGYFVIQYKF
jgi:hypothetical protein